MLIDATIDAHLATVGTAAAAAEDTAYDGVWVAEINHDPFLAALHAADRTSRATVGTGIAVAFARSPMTVAMAADDLQRHSGGRFVLGLGSQIRPHIERRFSMPWSHPADRMREFIQALRAIWRCWAGGEPLQFAGRFYTHTLMTPFFSPGPNPYGPPPVYLAAVGPRMTRVAAQEADGLFVHAFTTPRYLREVTIPAVLEGLAEAGRRRDEFTVCLPAFVVTGDDESETGAARQRTRAQIAFYGSTPAYRPVLALHGWEDLHTELNARSKQGEWEQMAAAIDDEVLHTFAVVGTPSQVAAALRERFAGLVDRLSFATHDGAAVPDGLVDALRD